MVTLGINAAFHDSSAALVKDGVVIAAVEEERFSRIKHAKRPLIFNAYELPFASIDYCLQTGKMHLNDIDFIAYSFDPEIKISPYSETQLPTLPLHPSSTPPPAPWVNHWDPLFYTYTKDFARFLIGRENPLLPKTIRGATYDSIKQKIVFVQHHLAHAASAFYPSPFFSAAVMTLDGQGEKTSTSYWSGSGKHLEKISEVFSPHSLGLLYERVTEYLGFLNSADEYKVMALASYGKPVFKREFNSIITIGKDGNYTIKQPLSQEFLTEVFGPPRKRTEPFSQKHRDIASSLQNALEEAVLQLVSWLKKQTKEENLCLAGGVALNCVLNAKIKKKSEFHQIFIQPAAGDAGTSLGAALWTDAEYSLDKSTSSHHQTSSPQNQAYFLDVPRHRTPIQKNNQKIFKRNYLMENVYLGPEYSDEFIEKILIENKLPFKRLDNIAEEGSKFLSQDKIIGFFQGRAEFGPRALGNRSILASPQNPHTQQFLNRIKDREDFRPVAPVVLEEEASKWFKDASSSPFMLFVYECLENALKKIPAVVHVDQTARIQTVNRNQNRLYYDLIYEFFKITGIPVLVNTSFNKDEPMVLSPYDALKTFYATPLDALIIGHFLLTKEAI